MTAAEYATISPVPYVRPAHPGILVILPGTAQHEATRLRSEHKESTRLFRETIDVEKCLIKQIVAALENKYLKSLRDPNSNSIMLPVYDVLTHLFDRYGRVDAETLADIDAKVRNLIYDISEPLVTLFNEIEELARLATAASNPYSDMQQVQIGLRVIKNTHDFEAGIREWYARPPIEHTWANLKTHFDTARALLRQIRGPDMQNSTFQQVNLLAASIRTDLEASQQHLLQAIAETTPDSDNIAPPETPSINAVTDNSSLIIELLRQLNVNVQGMNNANRGPVRQNRNKWYCWSHGMCGHKSSECRHKKAGHCDAATKSNRMNGSSRGCRDTA